MFSKVLAFGLGALALVHAAPAVSLKTPVLSCNVNFRGIVAPVEPLPQIELGNYKIFNDELPSAQLSTFQLDEPIFVSTTFNSPGPYGLWTIVPTGESGSNQYMIGFVVTSYDQPDSFSIQPAGNNTFTIKVPNEDKVWAIVPWLSKSAVFVRAQDGLATKWRFEKVDVN
ncbi:hypothetical protein C8R45DRAFT_1093691 [Mycena sanguinolenta]|nr:hypothetical protein C8R45DRAFT_1093691 [Mycena sanguinolenta]